MADEVEAEVETEVETEVPAPNEAEPNETAPNEAELQSAAQVSRDEAAHEARVDQAAKDRASIDVAEGVKVFTGTVERAAYVRLSEKAKPYLVKYGHDNLTHFLSAVGSDGALARKVVSELLDELLGANTPAAQLNPAEHAA
jgi:hypothetical protein